MCEWGSPSEDAVRVGVVSGCFPLVPLETVFVEVAGPGIIDVIYSFEQHPTYVPAIIKYPSMSARLNLKHSDSVVGWQRFAQQITTLTAQGQGLSLQRRLQTATLGPTTT